MPSAETMPPDVIELDDIRALLATCRRRTFEARRDEAIIRVLFDTGARLGERLLRLDGVHVTSVEFGLAVVVVTVALRRRRLVCPHRGHKTRFRYDIRPRPSSWRHLDLGV